jgi:hypothetical protein
LVSVVVVVVDDLVSLEPVVLGVVVVLVELFEASTFTDVLPGVVVVVLALPEGVVVVVVEDDEAVPLAGGAVGASLGFTSTLVLEDDEGGVVVSVLEQPTTPTPTARMAARRYDGFIVRVPSFGGR